MRLQFTKMHGIGNDYIYFNCLEKELDKPSEISKILSDRHFSVGGDGIVMICKSDIADAKMRMFNADGSEAQMCGNAIRCVGKYLYDNKIIEKTNLKIETSLMIETLSGIKELWLNVENNLVSSVKVDMGKAELNPAKIPVNLPGDKIIGRKVHIGNKDYDITCVSTGNPHCIVFCKDIYSLDLKEIGPLFEFADVFPDRINTEFIQVVDKNTLKMRVWERGSGETQACGTGACASVVAAAENGFCSKGCDIKVILLGGELIINYTDEKILMTGEAKKAFDGTVEI